MDRDYDYEDAWYDILDEHAHRALTSLARRENPDADIDHWCMMSNFNRPYSILCLICDRNFHSVSVINRHGMKHLKDSNLLAFV